jgi:hypothetical protein
MRGYWERADISVSVNDQGRQVIHHHPDPLREIVDSEKQTGVLAMFTSDIPTYKLWDDHRFRAVQFRTGMLGLLVEIGFRCPSAYQKQTIDPIDLVRHGSGYGLKESNNHDNRSNV